MGGMLGELPRSRTGLAITAGALVLVAVGACTAVLGAPAWLVAIAAAVSALVATTVVDRAYHAQDDRDDALQQRRQVLGKLISERAWSGKDVLELLRPEWSPAGVRGRLSELAEMRDWLADDRAPRVLLISGPAGVGKSRLALEFASKLPAGWVTGWLRAAKGGEAVAAVQACKEPAVILIDDADGRTDLVPLLDSLAEASADPAVRVVIVTRSAAGLRSVLAFGTDPRHEHTVREAAEIDLQPVGEHSDLNRWFDEAIKKFAELHKMAVPHLVDSPYSADPGATETFLLLQAKPRSTGQIGMLSRALT